jgi:hypothetical protein
MLVFQMFYYVGYLHLAEAELALYYARMPILCMPVGFQELPQYQFTFAAAAKLSRPAAPWACAHQLVILIFVKHILSDLFLLRARFEQPAEFP